MSIETLEFAEPFFTVRLVKEEATYRVFDRSIVLNLSEEPIKVQDQKINYLNSVIVSNTLVYAAEYCIVIERFDEHSDQTSLFEKVRKTWPSAWDVRKEPRLKGVGHYMSPKVWIGQLGLSMYHSASVPLKVGLHKFHDFCPVPGFREVHTQIVGFGKMQQCVERDIQTLYLEEPMAPGSTHRPMYDAEGNYPWHQYETITPSIFMAVEMLPEGASPPTI